MKHLHQYKTLRDDAEVRIEYCEICKKKLVTRKDRQGRIDNDIYREEHKINYLQPNHPLYKKYYGEEKSNKTGE